MIKDEVPKRPKKYTKGHMQERDIGHTRQGKRRGRASKGGRARKSSEIS